jgi:hypothetical protein
MDKLKALWTKFLSLKTWQKAVVVILLLSLVSAPFNGGSSSDSSSNGSSSSESVKRSYPVSYVRSAAVNPATLSVVFNVTNDGTMPIKPSCTIRMQDSSGTYKGYDIFEITDAIEASQTKQVIVQLTITKEGAEYADQFSGECSATTTDTETNAGKAVVISDIQNFSATEGSEGWYWGASFKANQKPMTQMDCVVKALDKNGKVIGETSYRGNTLNDGTVIGYGNDAQSLVDSTKSMVLAIKSFDVKCTL